MPLLLLLLVLCCAVPQWCTGKACCAVGAFSAVSLSHMGHGADHDLDHVSPVRHLDLPDRVDRFLICTVVRI